MVHQGQRLTLGFEPAQDFPGVHAGLDDLERDTAFDRFLLVGHIDHPAAAFANLLQQFIAANLIARLLGHEVGGRQLHGLGEKLPRLLLRAQQRFDLLTQFQIALAGIGQKAFPFRQRFFSASPARRFL